MSRVSTGNVLAFVTRSASTGELYTQRVDGSGHWSCECPDYMYRDHQCKHIKARKEQLVQERERLREVQEVLWTYTLDEVRERLTELNRVLGSP